MSLREEKIAEIRQRYRKRFEVKPLFHLDPPSLRWGGLTWVGWLNVLVLQWFCFRLAYQTPGPPTWSITRWVMPLTGWWNDYVWIGKDRS